jgi:uncharacterized Zn-binding protein involved in type VI secretion
MPPQSRIGDIGVGICCCHKDPKCIAMVGPIITGSPNHLTNGISSARFGDMILGYCGHPGTIITSSGTARINGFGSARIGDNFVGCFTGILVQGSPNTIVGG